MFGGKEGRLQYGPPKGFSPFYEALLPKQTIKIEPCFDFGDIPKNVITGPIELVDNTQYVPSPVDTSRVSFFTPHLTH